MTIGIFSIPAKEDLRRNAMSFAPKDGKKRIYSDLEEIYKSHRLFGLQALKELKRAERYCEFLSLVILDLSALMESRSKFFAKFSPRQKSAQLANLRDFIFGSVRETDIVSGFEENRIALLLAETPQEGAKTLSKRLEEGVNYFFKERLQLAGQLPVPLKVVSYPDKVKGREEIHQTIKDFIG